MDEVKLLPCPFCSGGAKLFQSQQTGLWFVTCNDCSASTGAQFINDTDEHIRAVVAAWNTRPTLGTGQLEEGDAKSVS